MKRNVLVFGAISGLIPILWFMIMMTIMPSNCGSESGMWYGYASMLLANIFMFVGVKNYRDKFQGGFITFGKAFKASFLIALVGSTCYVIAWLIYYYTSGTDFIEQYSAMMIKQLEASGASTKVIAAQTKEMKEFAVMYHNPFVNAMFTYMEILPLGIICALLTALILRKRQPVQV